MASLVDSLSQALMSPDTIDHLSRLGGVDSAQATRGLEVVGPIVLGSLARKSETTGGMDAIMRMLPDDAGGHLIDAVRAAGQRFNVAETANLLTGVLGPGVSTMGKALTSRLGFDVRPLMASATPALLALIGKTAKDQHLTSVDIARMLQAERSAVVASESPELNSLRTAALAVKAKSPVDAQSFGVTLVSVGREVAAASKEGGFLGIGGTRVSAEEEHALAEVAAAVS
jgi:hypothetical protein